MGVNVQKNLMDAGSRPASFARRLIFAILGARTDGAWPVTKMASACLDAKAEPALSQVSQMSFKKTGVGSLTAKFQPETEMVFVEATDQQYVLSPNQNTSHGGLSV